MIYDLESSTSNLVKYSTCITELWKSVGNRIRIQFSTRIWTGIIVAKGNQTGLKSVGENTEPLCSVIIHLEPVVFHENTCKAQLQNIYNK